LAKGGIRRERKRLGNLGFDLHHPTDDEVKVLHGHFARGATAAGRKSCRSATRPTTRKAGRSLLSVWNLCFLPRSRRSSGIILLHSSPPCLVTLLALASARLGRGGRRRVPGKNVNYPFADPGSSATQPHETQLIQHEMRPHEADRTVHARLARNLGNLDPGFGAADGTP